MTGKRRGRHPRNDLDAKKVAALIRKGQPGRYFDGNGLHLFIQSTGTASWVLRLTVNGVRKDYGAGRASIDAPGLAEAREAARRYQVAAAAGEDPTAEKRRRRTIPTFRELAQTVHATNKASWRNAKHGTQWLSTLEAYAFPAIGETRVDLIAVQDVLRVLLPIWQAKPETARRVRQRVRAVLDYAAAEGHRAGENPVGPVLAKALPKQGAGGGHHAAMPYAQVPEFLRGLGDVETLEPTALALRFLVLTAARTGEVIGMERDEIDLDGAVWSVPGLRMKSGRPHRVPLSGAAARTIKRALGISSDARLVFPGARYGKPMSNMAMAMALRRQGIADATVHGMRSAFRDWCAETTSFPAEVAEMALAHVVGDKTVRAYKRSDLFERRRELMAAWASYVAATPADVIVLAEARR